MTTFFFMRSGGWVVIGHWRAAARIEHASHTGAPCASHIRVRMPGCVPGRHPGAGPYVRRRANPVRLPPTSRASSDSHDQSSEPPPLSPPPLDEPESLAVMVTTAV